MSRAYQDRGWGRGVAAGRWPVRQARRRHSLGGHGCSGMLRGLRALQRGSTKYTGE